MTLKTKLFLSAAGGGVLALAAAATMFALFSDVEAGVPAIVAAVAGGVVVAMMWAAGFTAVVGRPRRTPVSRGRPHADGDRLRR